MYILNAISWFNDERDAWLIIFYWWRNVDAAELAILIQGAFLARNCIVVLHTTGNDQRSICPFSSMILKIESVVLKQKNKSSHHAPCSTGPLHSRRHFEHANCRQITPHIVNSTDDIVGWCWRNIDHVIILKKSGSVRIVLNGCPVTRAKVVKLGLDVYYTGVVRNNVVWIRADRQEVVLNKKVHFNGEN